MHFPISGVTVFPLIPLLAALGISFFTSMGGVSGAFVLLPFQVSVLGFVSPAVTPTNHLFNVVAIPSGVVRYIREGRMVWPLTTVIIIGTLPGVIAGSLIRLYLLPDPRAFKLFMGLVLLLIGGRVLLKVLKHKPSARGAGEPRSRAERSARNKTAQSRAEGGAERTTSHRVRVLRFDWRRLEYEYAGETHGISCPTLLLLTAVIGVIGGAYGVGGGAIISPFLVSMFNLPVHTIAGATLCGTCLTSIIGVVFFTLARPVLGIAGVSPDWPLGLLFGGGGLLGMYFGARAQRYVPARAIEAMLALVVNGLALSYVVGYFRG